MRNWYFALALSLISLAQASYGQVVLDNHGSAELLKRIQDADKAGKKDLALFLLHRKDTLINKRELTKRQLQQYAEIKGEYGTLRRKIWGELTEFLAIEKKLERKDYIGALGIFELDTFFIEHLSFFKDRYYDVYSEVTKLSPQLESDKRAVANSYRSQFKGSEFSTHGWSGSTQNCIPGTLSKEAYGKILQRWKYFRHITLTPSNIRLDPKFNEYAQQAALLLAANDSLLEVIEDTIPCYSNSAHTGLKYSRCNAIQTTDQILTDMIQGTEDETLEKRKLLLHPETNVYGFGLAQSEDGSMFEVNYVDGGRENIDDKDIPEFLAYPAPGFFPNALVFPKWSFTISKKSADFSQARVVIKTVNGKRIPVDVLYTGGLRGGTSIVWKMREEGILDYVDKVLNITIQRVRIGEDYEDYNYSLVLIETRK